MKKAEPRVITGPVTRAIAAMQGGGTYPGDDARFFRAPAEVEAGCISTVCDGAVSYIGWVNAILLSDDADEDRMELAVEVYGDVLDRAARMPSRTLDDVAAKARLLLCEYRNHAKTGADCIHERLAITILTEIVALAA